MYIGVDQRDWEDTLAARSWSGGGRWQEGAGEAQGASLGAALSSGWVLSLLSWHYLKGYKRQTGP